MNQYIQTIILAMIPIGELRLSIPIALTKYNLSIVEAYILSVIGNIIPVIFLLLFLEITSKFLIKHFNFFKNFFDWLFARTRNKIQKNYEIYGYLALVIFVAIPLPATGAWAGSAAAYLFGIPFWKALGLISTGIIIAGIIVTLTSVGILSFI